MIFENLTEEQYYLLPEVIAELRKSCDFIIRDNELIWQDEMDLLPTKDEILQALYKKEFEYLKNNLLEKNNNQFNYRVNKLIEGYPEPERLTWIHQEMEARAFLNNNQAETPIIDTLAKIRGLTKEEIANRIIKKTVSFTKVVSVYMAIRQKIEDIIEQTGTITDLKKLNIEELWNKYLTETES